MNVYNCSHCARAHWPHIDGHPYVYMQTIQNVMEFLVFNPPLSSEVDFIYLMLSVYFTFIRLYHELWFKCNCRMFHNTRTTAVTIVALRCVCVRVFVCFVWWPYKMYTRCLLFINSQFIPSPNGLQQIQPNLSLPPSFPDI